MTQKQADKYAAIIENYINGNISDAREQVKKLRKLEIVELIEAWSTGHNGAVASVKKLLE